MRDILVAYASRHGSTKEVAETIADHLRRRGETVDVLSVETVPDVSAYGAVVIGSGVNGARWLPEAVAFVRQHAAELRQVPVAIFSLHLMSRGDGWLARKRRASYVASVRAIVPPQHEAFFAGKSPEGPPSGRFVRAMSRVFGVGEGDLRDWQAIRAWADSLFTD